ncbi:hypothetical protein [Dactylosporangium sp. NPDC049140]|uniref:hypothetical protein n=1 Tax=Dactylosporangium sp. NPDC049140 TaxID=3155647 RepID=UPI0033D85DF4
MLATDGDRPPDWLAAGEATSAVWLAATAQGLVASPMSDVVEIPGARVLLSSLIHPAGQPQLVPRVGVDLNRRHLRQPTPRGPRRHRQRRHLRRRVDEAGAVRSGR